MKFSELIALLTAADMASDVQISQDCDLEDLNLMDREYRDFNDRTVYFIDADQIGPGTQFPNCLLYYGALPEGREKDLINSARITAASSAAVFRYVKVHLDAAPQAYAQYANIVSRLMSGTDLNTVLTEAFTYTGNLFVAIDMSGKILANSTPFYVDYPLWMNSVQQGYCDEILMDYIASRRRTLHAPKGPNPFSLYCNHIDMHILVARIIHENETLGYFFALNRKPGFDNQTKKMLPLFAQRAKASILRLKSGSSRGPIIQTNILMDALSGATPAETTQRSKISGLKFGKYMRVFTICTAYTRAPDFYSQILFPELLNLLPNRPLFPYQSSLVGLLDTDENGTLPPDLSEILTEFAQKHHLIIGISNIFSNISRFAEYAEQARRALSFYDRVSTSSPFFFYLDYGLYIVLDRIHDEKLLAQCCHPALERLSQYDSKKGTELFETLRVYTECGFSKTRTAQVLFIHRNTINYRIQQIEQLCGIDLSSENLLFTLQLSFKLNSYRQSRLIGSK